MVVETLCQLLPILYSTCGIMSKSTSAITEEALPYDIVAEISSKENGSHFTWVAI